MNSQVSAHSLELSKHDSSFKENRDKFMKFIRTIDISDEELDFRTFGKKSSWLTDIWGGLKWPI